MVAFRRRIFALWGAVAACTRGEPPAPAGIDAAASPLPPPAASPAPAAVTSAAPAPTHDAGDPGTLAQTKDKPKPGGEAFDARAATLWDAIVHDDPERALPFFFPVTAYEQVKDVGNPASDWKRRLVAAYKRDIHALHKRLGDKADTAKLVRFDVPDDRARWVDPNEEYNKIGYWRVYGTRIVYTPEPDAKERSFDISSLISWRGEWYVVHLTGFK